MANNGGMLQALVTIPSSYTMSITETGGTGSGSPIAVTVLAAAESGYWSSGTTLLSVIAGDLDASALVCTYSLVLSTTTGQITITANPGATGVTSIALTWTTTALRDLLGFDGTEAGTLAYTGSDSAKAVWIPDCPVETPFAIEDEGWYEYDAASTQAPDGTVVSTAYNRRVATMLAWRAVAASRVRIADETVANQSYQQFYDDCIYGAQAWATVGGPVRWFPDRTEAGTSTAYKIPVEGKATVGRMDQSWSGLYSVEIPRLVKVPT